MARAALVLVVLVVLTPLAYADFASGYRAFQERQYAIAFRELLPEARRGNSDAQWIVGALYFVGRGVKQNKVEGCRWTKLSAEQGNRAGEYYFGACYEQGVGVPKSVEQAMAWLRRSAEHGLPEAQVELGTRLLDGTDDIRNAQEAAAWFIRAADQGEALGMLWLGAMYERGLGVAANPLYAYAWYKLAVKYEHERKMRDNNVNAFKRVTSKLTQEERRRGDQLAIEFEPTRLDRGRTGTTQNGSGSEGGKSQSLNAALIQALEYLGYDAGLPRDSIDRHARDAIKAFQKDHGMPASGRVSKKLITAVNAAIEEKAGADGDSRTGSSRAVASGTGFVITAEGHVLTNNHVINGCREMRDGRGEVAKVLASDKAVDLAVLKLFKPREVTAVFRDGADARPGEDIVVLGFPLHGLLGSDPIVTTGTVSALAGLQNNRNQIQISAPVQPGNSGGPVLDASGHVVGVVVSKLDAVKVANAIGDIPENVNFAINEATARRFLDDHKIKYVLENSSQKLSAPDIASKASGFTVLLECFK